MKATDAVPPGWNMQSFALLLSSSKVLPQPVLVQVGMLLSSDPWSPSPNSQKIPERLYNYLSIMRTATSEITALIDLGSFTRIMYLSLFN
jgi:hypothetical protein